MEQRYEVPNHVVIELVTVLCIASGMVEDIIQHGSGAVYHIIGITAFGLHGMASGAYSHGGGITIEEITMMIV